MNILITGGTGLIGKELAASLLKNGNRVVILTRRAATSIPGGEEFVTWDGRTPAGWGHMLNEMDAVVNLAGENIGSFPWTAARKEKFRRSRLDAGAAVLAAFQSVENKPRMLIQASAVGYYGPRGDARITETTPAGDDFSAHLCLDWEASTQAVEALGVRRVVIRTGIVLSLAGGSLPLMALPVWIFAGGPMGSGRQGVSWIHIQDEVSAIRFLLENDSASGPFNLSAPSPLSNADFARALAKTIHRPYWLPAPKFALKLALGDMSSLLLDSQFMVPARLLEAGFEFKFEKIESAMQNLYRQ